MAVQTRVGVLRNVFAYLRPYTREPKWAPAPVRGEPSAVIGMTGFLERKPKSSRTRLGPQRDYNEAAAGD